MSDTVKLNHCPKCGAPIPAEAPQGLCPKCILVGAATATETGAPATATSEIPSLERVAAAFPQLEILELIGRGGMGFVFKARQPHLDRFVALKLLPDKLARDPRFAERFNREGRVLAKLNHPNIVSVYDFGQTEHFYFLLMEFVDGVNLRQAMKAGRFSPGEALAIVPMICGALQYAHGQGILHRDIKPENILLDARGHVKIADFGIAKLVGEEKPDIALTATGAALGTPHYMAPEQLEHPLTVDHRADIYSLGVVFYEMLTGELPIGRFAAPSSKTPVGTAVDDVVFRTLEKDRERRYQSAGEMKTQVEHLTSAPPGEEHGARPALPVDNSEVVRPAKALLATGIFNWLVSIVVVCLLAFTKLGHTWPITPSELGVVCVLILVLSTFIIVGALKMLRLESYPLAVFGSALAMITSPGAIVGLPVGIWSLLTLRRASVRASFKQNRPVELPPKLPIAGHGLEVPKWSQKAVWGAVLTGLSVPLPMLMAVLAYFSRAFVGSWELLLGAASIGLPGLVGTILGWMALSDIRAHQGRLRGLPLAVFAALAYPLLILVGATLVIPWVLSQRGGGPGTGMPLAALFVLLIPVGLITFGIWAVYAAARWGANKPPTRRRGVLKWVFLGLLFAVIGVLSALNFLQGKAPQENQEEPYADLAGIPTQPAKTPWIRFTFTAVELRDIAGARWLAIDYVDDVHGDCQKAFPWEANIPGFKAETRTSAFLKQDKGSPLVRHQRIEYRMPDSAPREQLDKLREDVELALKQKSVRLELGEQEPPFLLFELPGAEGGSLKAWVKAVPPLVAEYINVAMSDDSQPKASAELWSPKLAPGEKPNLSDLLQEARSLAQDTGSYEEALQRHIWYHNHALDTDASQAGVRLSFALSYWMDLARRYPKAKAALVEIRDRGAQELAAGGGHSDLFMEVNAINRQLGQKDATLALFNSIRSRDLQLALQCYEVAEDLLVEKGDYALCASFVLDVQSRFETFRAARERMMELANRTPEANQTLIRKQAERAFIKDTRQLIEILVGVGRKAEAENIRDQAMAVLDLPELQSALTDAERKVANRSVPTTQP